MKTVIGNWENDCLTVIYPRYDDALGYVLTEKQKRRARARMGMQTQLDFRYIPVQGARLDDGDIENI